MCWATDGVTFVQYWVTSNGESKVLCTVRPAESTPPEQIQTCSAYEGADLPIRAIDFSDDRACFCWKERPF
jgi:hypothetical protein